MQDTRTRKLTLAGILAAMAVLGGVFSFPVLGSRCAPVQHLVNILAAVLLGPLWGVGIAFSASLLRNIAGLGSLMAFPGSMIGALACGTVYYYTRRLGLTCVAEALGTGLFGALAAYPVAVPHLHGRRQHRGVPPPAVSAAEDTARVNLYFCLVFVHNDGRRRRAYV